MSTAEGARAWLGRSVESLREEWGIPRLQIHDRVTSTNDVARELANMDAPEGTTVIADLQTDGRGRRGREWTAPEGSSLLLSMVLRPRTPGAETILSIRLGLAAARAIEAVAPVTIALKWPNDLLVQGLKVGGILCEGAVEHGRSLYVVAGVGLNVTQRDEDWPPDLRTTASSLEARIRRTIDRARLAGAVVTAWLAAASRDSARLSDEELDEFQRRDLLVGHDLTVDGEYAGVGQGIGPDGVLRVRVPGASGSAFRRIVAGTVRCPDLLAGDTS